MEFIIVGVILIFLILYRKKSDKSVYSFISEQANSLYEKYVPYTYNSLWKNVKKRLHNSFDSLFRTPNEVLADCLSVM